MNSKYETLVGILDHIREDAPPNLYTKYQPSPKDKVKVGQARTRAFIHLYLMVKHGLEDFRQREDHITDDKFDGGLDAYYIDHSKKKIYLIQSKIHHTEGAFETNPISADDLIKMEIGRIIKGRKKDEVGNKYNDRIRNFQKQLRSTNDVYEHIVVLLANVIHSPEKIRKLIGGNFPYEVFNYKTTYDELVFPFASGTYHDPYQVPVNISLVGKEQVRLKQDIKTSYGRFEVTVVFAPTKEIGSLTSTYKNAILKFNPRNFLSLSGSPVNRGIKKTVTRLSTNDLALLNNGITILADDVTFTDNTGIPKVARLLLTNPQIINGGQTAYTLAEIFENDFRKDPQIFDGKEVMLKIVKLGRAKKNKREDFIESVSNATNKQTNVKEPDRRSNNPVLRNIQSRIYENFGYFVALKKGEFYNGLSSHVLEKSSVIDRVDMVRSYLAFIGQPSAARSKGENPLFRESQIEALFKSADCYVDVFYAAMIHSELNQLEKDTRPKNYGAARYGNALRYGKFAVVAAVAKRESRKFTGKEDISALAKDAVVKILARWKDFEKWAKKRRKNIDYFSMRQEGFDNYYKGSTVDADIKVFFH